MGQSAAKSQWAPVDCKFRQRGLAVRPINERPWVPSENARDVARRVRIDGERIARLAARVNERLPPEQREVEARSAR
jgi:hypothetical protein